MIKKYGDLPLVECYASQLNQVFMNLLANAIDALETYNKERSPEQIKRNPSQLEIQTETTNTQSVSIKIRDNGIGIPKAAQKQLFDPFFTTKPVGQGTGLGLAISYQIVVDKHHGKLTCHSTPGAGTEFIIELPLRQKISDRHTIEIAKKLESAPDSLHK